MKTTRIVVMTRLPEVGRNKTRLIPALGAEGAMRMHDRLARHTIARCSTFCDSVSDAALKICVTGGTSEDARNWLVAENCDCSEQSAGDLGERMWSAMCQEFSEGAKKVIIVGTDCPDLDESILTEATTLLEDHDVIFGPAADGGYYLIATRKPVAALFKNIPWSTGEVLEKSLSAARSENLTVALLRELRDVDLPEDLAYAESSLRNVNSED